MCKWLLLRFSRNKSFPEILSSGEYKKCWFLKTQDSVFVFRNSICLRLDYRSSFLSSHIAPFKPSRQDWRASATTTTSKIDLSSDTSFWIFWPILSELHSLKKVTFWGKIHCQFRCLHTTLWRLICPGFPKKLASHNSMQNKDDKVGNKTANKQERQREKREQERKIEKDSQKRSKFWLLRMCEKQKSSLISQISWKPCLFSCKILFKPLLC